MKKIKIFDTTLRDGEQSPGCSMNLDEKIEVAKQLQNLGVDIIEAGFAIASPMDFKSVESIAKTVKGITVASLSRAAKKDIEAAYNAVKYADDPLIHTFLATSPLHREYKLKLSKEEIINQIYEMVRYAKTLCPSIEFSCEDAMRTEKDFLAEAVYTAIKAGATVVNIPDTVGYVTPAEVTDYITYLRKNVPNIDKADISVHCHDDLGMAVANTLAAVKAGATQAECTINGIGERAGNASLEEIVMAINTRGDYYNAETSVNAKEIYKSSRLVSSITGVSIPPNKSIVGENAFAHESGIHQHGVMAHKGTYEIMTPAHIGIKEQQMVLGKHSGKHAFADRIKSFGYNLDEKEMKVAFDSFKNLADKKKTISDKDLLSLIEHNKPIDESQYMLENFITNAGNNITATATISLSKEGKKIEKVAMGDGPIDASFKAINKITKTEFGLNDFTIQAVTEGEDALGEVMVKLALGDVQYTGRGVSTDIVEASIKAYLNGVNKHLA